MPPVLPSHPGHPGELVLLAAERTVTVTREEHHQDVLAGRVGPAVAELRPGTITAGKHAGQYGIEVVLDGRRVGELTHLMAQRYRPVVDELRARRYRVGCEAVLRDNARGIQVELRMPATGGPATRPSVPPRPAAARPPQPPWAPPTTVAPGPPAPTHTFPRPAGPTSHDVPGALPTGRRRTRRLLWVTGGVVGVLVLASALGSGSPDETPTSSTSALSSAVAAPAAPAPADPVVPVVPVQESGGVPVVEPVDEPAAAPAPRPTTRSRPPTPTKPETRAVEAAPKPAPEPEVAGESPGCDSNYDGCVPIARDVDCEGGNGDGPAYVAGPVRVIGSDIYGLDRGGEPGVGCE